MYNNGEIEEVMAQFEKATKVMPVYVSGNMEKAERVEVELEDGRTSKRYMHNNYYNNGNVNQMFLFYLQGYSFGKAAH